MLTSGDNRPRGYRGQGTSYSRTSLSAVPCPLSPVTYEHPLRSASRLNDHRRAFTLIEILVVIAIIAILAALVARGLRAMVGAQQESNTITTIKTLASALDRQWSAVVATASKEPPPTNVLTMAGGHPGRAKVIWVKLRLRQEFPMNLSEVISPSIAGGLLSASDLAAKPSYVSAASQAGLSASSNASVWPLESSFTLKLALMQNRGGGALSEDNFASNALATQIYTYTTVQPIQPTGNAVLSGPKMLVDGWSGPIIFYRWPTKNPDPDCTSAPAAAPIDPDDPDGLLLDPSWNNAANFGAQAGVYWFEQYCHPVHAIVGGTYTPVAYKTRPAIISAGPDHNFGYLASANPYVADNMTPATPNVATYDNITSYGPRK